MTSNSNFYSPKDNSLEERLRAFQKAYKAWLDVEASFHFHDQEGWEDRLGSKEDLLGAKEIICTSLDMAVFALSNSEIEMALDQKLIAGVEADYFFSNKGYVDKVIIEARKKEISNARTSSSERSKDRGFDKE